MAKKIIRLTESELKQIIKETTAKVMNEMDAATYSQSILNDPLLMGVDGTFDYEVLKTENWKNGDEIVRYCESCGLLRLGEGIGRIVFQIDDEKVLKIQKGTSNQNELEVESFRSCDESLKQFFPNIFDWDKRHIKPLWIISEQVLTATYADFQKILGIDFGSYKSQNDIHNMKKDLDTYSKYPGKTVSKYAINLMDFLESFDLDNANDYQYEIKHNKWLNDLFTLLIRGVVSANELEIINNWGLVYRNGEPKLIILDIGI